MFSFSDLVIKFFISILDPVTSPELQTISEVPKIKVSGLSEIEGSQETSVLDLSLEELKISADGFSQESYLGEGGSGRVFKGNLYTGAEVAIKVLKSMELSDSDFLSMVCTSFLVKDVTSRKNLDSVVYFPF